MPTDQCVCDQTGINRNSRFMFCDSQDEAFGRPTEVYRLVSGLQCGAVSPVRRCRGMDMYAWTGGCGESMPLWTVDTNIWSLGTQSSLLEAPDMHVHFLFLFF